MQLRSPLHRIAAALSSLAAIALLLVGVPLALWVLAGSPLPAGIPSITGISDALTKQGLTDSTLIKIVAAVGWVAWLQVSASLFVEAAAWIRGRPAPHVRFAGPIQPMARKLVATAALLLSTSHAAAFASADALPVRPVAAATPFGEMSFAINSSVQRVSVTAAAPTTTAIKTYTVVRYDTLWGLAEAHLRDPFRWHEIYDLNHGRMQADGRALTDPDLIQVGWTLTFPADATGLDPIGVPPPPVVADPRPPVAPPTTTATPPTTTVAVTTPTPSTRPAQIPTPNTSVPVPATPRATTADDGAHEPGTTDNEHRQRVLWPLVGGALAAAGVVTLLARLRRVQQRRRPTGHRPRPPRPQLEQIERRLRHVADLDTADFLDLSLRAFAAGTANGWGGPPQLLAVRAGRSQVELLLASAPDHPPKGFIVTDGDRGWITDPDLDIDDLRALAAGAAAPLPGLVSIGELDGEQLLIDVETAGLLTADGSCADALLHSIALQLATSTWIDHLDVILVTSTTTADIANAARVRRVQDLATGIEELTAIAHSLDEALQSTQAPTTLHARFSEQHDDGWIPTILVCTQVVDAETIERLRDIIAGGGRGVGAVLRSNHHGNWHAQVEPNELLLSPLGLHITPSLIDAAAAAEIDELLIEAAVADNFETEHTDESSRQPATQVDRYVDPAFEIEVKLLGPVEIAGLAAPIERRRAEELVVYLALHPKGASDDRIKTVLWREQSPTDGTFNTTVSFARTSIGHAADGSAHFPHYSAAGHTYRLGPLVTTDLARFEARIAHAKSCNAGAAIETLRSSLELVRGAPFEGTRGYEWAFSEGIIANAEAMIADAAHWLAELCLAASDHAGATWAAMRGLKASPGDEALYRDRMLACHLAGNPAGVEAAMDELCAVVEALEPYDSLQPETLALYQRLSNRPGGRRDS